MGDWDSKSTSLQSSNACKDRLIGIKWRIGDGNGVRLWDDPCHNDDINFYLRTLGIQNIE
ncbi:hypothetical protein ACS0TY_000394 [Phlomoides rotata]